MSFKWLCQAGILASETSVVSVSLICVNLKGQQRQKRLSLSHWIAGNSPLLTGSQVKLCIRLIGLHLVISISPIPIPIPISLSLSLWLDGRICGREKVTSSIIVGLYAKTRLHLQTAWVYGKKEVREGSWTTNLGSLLPSEAIRAELAADLAKGPIRQPNEQTSLWTGTSASGLACRSSTFCSRASACDSTPRWPSRSR